MINYDAYVNINAEPEDTCNGVSCVTIMIQEFHNNSLLFIVFVCGSVC